MAAIQHPPQTHLRRPSPFSSHRAHLTNARTTMTDSESDDEPPPAIKFSKVTEALLNDRPIPSSPIKHDNHNDGLRPRPAIAAKLSIDTPSRPGIKISRKSSPSAFGGEERGVTPPRIVHIGSAQKGSTRRTISIAGPYPHRGVAKNELLRRDGYADIVTPAPSQRAFVRARASSDASQELQASASSAQPTSAVKHLEKSTAPAVAQAQEAVSRFSNSIRTRSALEHSMAPSSQRLKRGPIATGTFLKSGPVRRYRRRDSDDNASPIDEHNPGPQSAGSSNYTPYGASSRSDGTTSRNDTRATSVEPISIHDFADKRGNDSRPNSRHGDQAIHRPRVLSSSRPSSRQDSYERPRSRQASVERPTPSVSRDMSAAGRRPSIDPHQPRPVLDQQSFHRQPTSVNKQYRYVGSIASDDQENIPPPTFKRNKDQDAKQYGHAPISMIAVDGAKHHISCQSPLSNQPQPAERKVLGAMSGNTPHRAAPPPPPKMTVLQTATASAGASTTKTRKKRTHVVLNGKIFTQMGKIGKGGSSDVYCVMAENFKTFAMKKVKLEDCDESAVRGYKGEIDLLKKLTEVDRVVRLFDWELNEEKQELLVLMEKGDTDLNRVLTLKTNSDGAVFDAAFTRYHWKEMLECVQAVHNNDIVHSDLKPANFLVVQGRLKLIDFGIANAIDIDNTCNVHRDSHVGTPNYMSPESITDTNAPSSGFSSGKDAFGRPLKKDMRIGKSSDVWSLGCILYQMAYGRPPFAHISNQITRIMAITNPKHAIEFPDTGIGGAKIPPSLKGILKRCLQRDADRRPTIPQLLSDKDDFLNPEHHGAVMIRQEVLDQIINKVVERCRDAKRGIPTQTEVAQYAPSFMQKMRDMAEQV